MKQGINFATRANRGTGLAGTVGWLAMLVVLAATAFHAFAFVQIHNQVEALRAERLRREDRLGALQRQMEAARRTLDTLGVSGTVRQLVALERSGATRAASPSALLSLLAEALPPEARIISVNLKPSPPELRFEAMAGTVDAASHLLGEIAGSPRVARAEILEERHLSDGEIYLRIEARLSSPEDDR